jgi:hypothetical protein
LNSFETRVLPPGTRTVMYAGYRTVNASVGGRAVLVEADGEGDGDGGGIVELGGLGAELLLVPVGLGVPPAAVPTSPPPPSPRSSHQLPASRTTTAPTTRRTQKPRSGSGVPVPGTV